MMKSGSLSHDSRLRCDMVDLYFALYGSKRPPGMCSAELSAIFKPQKITSSIPLKGFVKAEVKSRPESPIDEKPHISNVPIALPEEQIISVDELNTIESSQPGQSIDVVQLKDDSMIEVTDIKIDPDSEQISRASIKEEIIDVDELDKSETMATEFDQQPPMKRQKTDFNSDNSASLPGIPSTPGEMSGPIGFEPGMFKQEGEEGVAVQDLGESGGKSKADGSQKVSTIYLIFLRM